jgi:hypothetical protein
MRRGLSATVLLQKHPVKAVAHDRRPRKKASLLTDDTRTRFEAAHAEAAKLAKEGRARLIRSRRECFLSQQKDE